MKKNKKNNDFTLFSNDALITIITFVVVPVSIYYVDVIFYKPNDSIIWAILWVTGIFTLIIILDGNYTAIKNNGWDAYWKEVKSYSSATFNGSTNIQIPGTKISENFHFIYPKYKKGAPVGKYLIKAYCKRCSNWGYHVLDKFKDEDNHYRSRGHTECCNCGAYENNMQIESEHGSSGFERKFDKSQYDTRTREYDSNIYKRPSDEFLNEINIYNLKKDSDRLPRYKLLSPPGRYLRSGWCYYTNQWTDYEVEIIKSANSIFTDDCVFGREDHTGTMRVTCLDLKKLFDDSKVSDDEIYAGTLYKTGDDFYDIHTSEVQTSDNRFAPTMSHPDIIFDRFKENWDKDNISCKKYLEKAKNAFEEEKKKRSKFRNPWKNSGKNFFDKRVTEYQTDAGMDFSKNKKTSTKNDNADAITQIEKLAELRDKSIITEEEFQKKKTELLDSIGK